MGRLLIVEGMGIDAHAQHDCPKKLAKLHAKKKKEADRRRASRVKAPSSRTRTVPLELTAN